MTLVLSGADVRALLEPAACVAAVREAMVELSAGRVAMPQRLAMPLAGGGEHLSMPAWAMDAGLAGLKSVAVAPGNVARGRPRIVGAMLLLDAETGELLALLDAAELTLARTAAASAVATDALARSDACVVALVGTGPQAAAHLAALPVVRRVAEVRVAGRTEAAGRAFAEAHGVAIAAGVEDAVGGADVVCLVTSARAPVIRRGWLADGCHVNAVGAHAPDAREVDADTMAAARVVCDSREAVLAESGDCLLPIADGRFGPEHVSDELGEVLAGRVPGRSSEVQLTVYVSVGVAAQDLAVARLAYERARAAGRGTRVAL